MTPTLPVRILAVQYLPNADPELCKALGVEDSWRCLALLSTDSDDATYIALDEATKASTVRVTYARSLYAGAANSATPLAGEVIGILAGRYQLVRNIGQQNQQVILFLLALSHLRLQYFGMLFHGCHFLLGGIRILLTSLLHKLAYLLCLYLLICKRRVKFCLAGPAASILLKYLFYYLRSVKVLDCQPLYYEFRLFSQKFKSQHLYYI